MANLRILYAASEIAPFLSTSTVANAVRVLAQHMHTKGLDIRILVPRFGVINERKNRLHEVVRLSGTNISLESGSKSLLIKVASIPEAKLQVYFIDNEDFFKRKAVFDDLDKKFFEDNNARTIFFCKGILETVKKLGWAPDIIHCHDWMTSLVPMYLKNVYNQDPILKKARTIFTVYNTGFSYKFEKTWLEALKGENLDKEARTILSSADFGGLVKTGMQYADMATRAEALQLPHFMDMPDTQSLLHIDTQTTGLDMYYDYYKSLTETTSTSIAS